MADIEFWIAVNDKKQFTVSDRGPSFAAADLLRHCGPEQFTTFKVTMQLPSSPTAVSGPLPDTNVKVTVT